MLIIYKFYQVKERKINDLPSFCFQADVSNQSECKQAYLLAIRKFKQQFAFNNTKFSFDYFILLDQYGEEPDYFEEWIGNMESILKINEINVRYNVGDNLIFRENNQDITAIITLIVEDGLLLDFYNGKNHVVKLKTFQELEKVEDLRIV